MSNGSTNFLDKACELVKQAIDADVKQEWAEAFKLYKSVSLQPHSTAGDRDQLGLGTVRGVWSE